MSATNFIELHIRTWGKKGILKLKLSYMDFFSTLAVDVSTIITYFM